VCWNFVRSFWYTQIFLKNLKNLKAFSKNLGFSSPGIHLKNPANFIPIRFEERRQNKKHKTRKTSDKGSVPNPSRKLCYGTAKWQKMTTRCALYMGALKIFESPWVCPRLLAPKIFYGLLFRSSILWMCVGLQNLKFTASPTHSWDNRGYSRQKIGQPMDTPTVSFLPIFNGLLLGWTL